MRETRRPVRRVARWCVPVSIALAAFLLPLPAVAASPYPTLPVSLGSAFLSNLTGPDIAPGGQGSLSFQVADPPTFAEMTGVVLTLDVYAFNAFPGNATSSIASAGAPTLLIAAGSGSVVNVSVGSLLPGQRSDGSVGVATASDTPAGTYAVRTALSFAAGGTAYRLESRGWFSASVWAAATELPNGSTTLNLTTLGVSGVTAETAILVSTSSWDWALAFVLGASLILIGAGAYVYFRRGPKSSSGAR